MTHEGKIRIGMISCGGNARHHMGQLLKLNEVEIVALTDPDPAQIAEAKRSFPQLNDRPAFNDYKQMIAQVPMDAVEISTPHTTHYEQILHSLDKGLHVLCEKPLVCTVAHAKDVVAKLKASGKVGLLSYQRHYQAEFRYIREQISSGRMGEVTFVNALQCQNWKKGTSGKWRQIPELSGGGQLNDSGSHLLDIILWVTGLGVSKVSAYVDNLGTPVDINSAISFTFRNGGQGNISVVGDSPDWHEDLTIWCEKGFFLLRNGRLQICDERGNRFSVDQLRGESFPDKNFVDAIKGRDTVHATFEDGLRVIELTEAAWKSGKEGGTAITVG